jgi:hypothetical protein
MASHRNESMSAADQSIDGVNGFEPTVVPPQRGVVGLSSTSNPSAKVPDGSG